MTIERMVQKTDLATDSSHVLNIPSRRHAFII